MKHVTCILKLPPERVEEFQHLAREACANATPQPQDTANSTAAKPPKRVALPCLTDAVLRKLSSPVEVDIAARLLADLARLQETHAGEDGMVKSSLDMRARCLRRAPAIQLADDEEEGSAAEAVQRIFLLLVANDLVERAERYGRTWYRLADVDNAVSAYEALLFKATERWHALRKPASNRPRLLR